MSGALMTAVLKQAERLFRERTLAASTDDRLLGRFLDDGDEDAFAALVARHGPMVLGACLDVLRDPTDAEDAFQATFLTLARWAGSIRGRDSLGGWLRRVARRSAYRANAEARRRRRREEIAAATHSPSTSSVHDGLEQEELRRAIGDEIDRLPESYRRPVVLCLVEGLPQPEAAGRLRVSEGAIRGRLARARVILRDRLTRRGVAPTARTDSPIVPSAWVVAVLAAVRDLPARRAVLAGWAGVSVRIATVVLVSASMVTLAAGLSARSPAEPPAPPAFQPPPRRPQAVTEPPPPALLPPAPLPQAVAGQPPVAAKPGQESETIVLRGKVFGPEGRPIGGARLYLIPDVWSSPVERGVSFDGSYRITLPRETFSRNFGGGYGGYSWPPVQASLIVIAEGLGPGWVDLGESVRRENKMSMEAEYVRDIHLPADYPIVGRVVDEGGKAVAGAVIAVQEIRAVADGDWVPVFAAVKAGKIGLGPSLPPDFHSDRWSRPFNHTAWEMMPNVDTDADGRFRIAGVGRDRAILLSVNGPGVRSTQAIVLTRDDVAELTRAMRVEWMRTRQRDSLLREIAVFDPSPTIEMEPARTVAGVVRDARTGAPIPGAKIAIFSGGNLGRAPISTDAHGRYRITRQDNWPSFWIRAEPDQSDRYLSVARRLTSAGETGETVGDFTLPRGAEVTGRVLESGTAKPIVSALGLDAAIALEKSAGCVHYFPLSTNTALRGTAAGLDFEGPPQGDARHLTAKIDGDGRFRIAVPPGPGVLLVQADPGLSSQILGFSALTAQNESDGPHRLFPYAPLKVRAGDDGAPGGEASTLSGFASPVPIAPYHAYRVIDPPADASALKVDFTIPRAPSRLLRFVGPDGRPVRGFMVSGLVGPKAPATIFSGAEAEAIGLEIGRPREIIARSDDGMLGVRTFIGLDDPQPRTIRLEPTGTVTGRLVDESRGGPLVRYAATCVDRLGYRSPDTWATDADGRFTIPGMVPGLPATIFVKPPLPPNAPMPSQYPSHNPKALWNLDLRAGEKRDVGDVRIESAWR